MAEKDFTVPEEIYNQYSVGDQFDCQNLNVTGKEEETETAKFVIDGYACQRFCAVLSVQFCD